MRGQTLEDDQELTEIWRVGYARERSSVRRDDGEYILARMNHWQHGTYYGESNVSAKTVHEARLKLVLGLARGICNDPDAFQHEASTIVYQQILNFLTRLMDELQEGEPKNFERIAHLEQIIGEFQENFDFYPEGRPE